MRFIGARSIEGDAEPKGEAGASQGKRGKGADLHGRTSLCATWLGAATKALTPTKS